MSIITLKSHSAQTYQPNETIIAEGDPGGDLYIVVATEETAHFAEVEVVTKNVIAGRFGCGVWSS